MLVAKLFGPPCFFTEIVKFYSLHARPWPFSVTFWWKEGFPGRRRRACSGAKETRRRLTRTSVTPCIGNLIGVRPTLLTNHAFRAF